MYTASILCNSGMPNPSRELTTEEADEFRSRVVQTITQGVCHGLLMPHVRLSPPWGMSVHGDVGRKDFFLIAHQGVVVIFNESGTPDLFADVAGVEDYIRYCMRAELEHLSDGVEGGDERV